MTYRVLSLFAGIGGFDLGLERTGGFKTVAFCEIDKKAQRVLARHWPGVPIYDDVSTLTAERLSADGIAVDCIVGGFPCQDISLAGKGAGLAGKRSGLWSHYARIIGELRPGFVIVENVSALLGRGLGDVLGDLASLGFDAEWHCIPASAVGAPHRRDRVWIVAYPNDPERWAFNSSCRRVAREVSVPQRQEDTARPGASGEVVSDPNSPRLSLSWSKSLGADWKQGGGLPASNCWWTAEPSVGRMAHGVPGRVDRLKQLGNAVVPQIPELIGRAILAAEDVP